MASYWHNLPYDTDITTGMKIIDLSLPLTHRMPVYPGDPEVEIVEIHTLAKEGWNLRQLTITTHLGTHVNAPYHMMAAGQKLDAFPIEKFMGKLEKYQPDKDWDMANGLLFCDQTIDQIIADKLIKRPPKFLALSAEFEFDVELEKILLENNIISFENIANAKLLPDICQFYGVPLSLPGADGSPVRAFAVIE